jgi:hypothetical protein
MGNVVGLAPQYRVFRKTSEFKLLKIVLHLREYERGVEPLSEYKLTEAVRNLRDFRM